MATKNKKRAKRRPIGDLFQQAQRSFAKGHFKQALKDAKACHRQQPGEKTHELLQRAYFARARELHRFGLREESRGAVEKLLELGVTEPSVQQELPELLIALGMFDRGAGGRQQPAEEVDSPLLIAVADHAVLRPREAPASVPAVRQGALRIRAALAALEAGSESEVSAALRDIARGSPFADWKYFVRGLAAHYRQDTTEMRANWERLDPSRFAARIAGRLTALAYPEQDAQNDRHLAGTADKLAREVLGGPVLNCLHELQGDIAADRWKGALRGLKRSQQTLRRFDPGLLQRIGLVIYPLMVSRGVERPLNELTSLMTPLPIDPRWNRARAMVRERCHEADIDEVEAHWLRYIEELAALPCLTPEERTLARALVWLRLGRHFVDASEVSPTFFGPPQGYVEQMRTRVVECFAECIRLAPNLRSAHEAVAKAHVTWEQPQQAANAYRRLLEHFPEDFEALRFLAVEHQRRDEPFEAREYALRAHRLKPLDRTIEDLVWTVHVTSARHYALAEEWEKGRAEFEAAEKITPQNVEPYHLLVCEAALEYKAGELGLGHRLVERARSEAGEPTSVLLYLTIQAIRYALPKAISAEFEHQWVTALKKKCNSSAAGRMCKILRAYVLMEIDYPGLGEHVGHLSGYLRRCSRVKWQASDLCNVCSLLDTLSEEEERFDELYDGPCAPDELLEKFVRKGLETFPENPYFHCMTGELEVRLGPMGCNRRYAYDCLQQALELAKDSRSAEDAEVAERAKRLLTMLGEVGLDARGGFGGPLPSPFYDDESFLEGEEDDEYDSDDSDEYDSDESDEYDHEALPDLPPSRLFGIFAEACKSQGLDPGEVLDRMAAELPLPAPLRTSNTSSRSKRKNKRKKKR